MKERDLDVHGVNGNYRCRFSALKGKRGAPQTCRNSLSDNVEVSLRCKSGPPTACLCKHLGGDAPDGAVCLDYSARPCALVTFSPICP